MQRGNHYGSAHCCSLRLPQATGNDPACRLGHGDPLFFHDKTVGEALGDKLLQSLRASATSSICPMRQAVPDALCPRVGLLHYGPISGDQLRNFRCMSAKAARAAFRAVASTCGNPTCMTKVVFGGMDCALGTACDGITGNGWLRGGERLRKGRSQWHHTHRPRSLGASPGIRPGSV